MAAIDGLALGGGLEVAMVLVCFILVIIFDISEAITSLVILVCSIRHAMHAFQLPQLN